MPQMKKEKKAKAKKYIARLLRDRRSEIVGRGSKPSPDKIQALLKKELDMHVTRTTIRTYINKEDMDKYLIVSNFEGNEQIKEYNDIMQSAKNMWDNEANDPNARTKAYNSYLRAKKQKEQLETSLNDEVLKKAEIMKPNYLISFNPNCALRHCPKCGHDFYDREVEKKKEEKTAWDIKPKEGQTKFDDFKGDKDNDKKDNKEDKEIPSDK